MGYLNKICKFISRLCTIWKLNQHTTKGKNPLSTFPKDIVHYYYYDIHIFHHSNFTISNCGSIKFRTFPLYSTLWSPCTIFISHDHDYEHYIHICIPNLNYLFVILKSCNFECWKFDRICILCYPFGLVFVPPPLKYIIDLKSPIIPWIQRKTRNYRVS